jgi:hypothetical protein
VLRAPRLLAAAGAVVASGLVLSACGPMHPGAAATVGNTRISVTQVKAGADTMLKDKGTANGASSNADLQRQVLTRIIKDQLIADAAHRKGVSVSEGAVQDELSTATDQAGGKDKLEVAAAGQGIAANDLHDFIYYALLQQELGKALTKDIKINTADIAIIALQDSATAEQVLAEVKADPSKFADVAKAKSLDTTTGPKGGDVGQVPIDTLPAPLNTDLASKDVGSIFVEQIQGAYYVILLKARDSKSVSDLDGTQAAQQAQQAAFTKYLSSVSNDEGVTISPRYGSWDSDSLTVTPSSGALTSPLPSKAS